jgi:UDP:flavonoid glycosyltransferase YjiC (YdhE family)
LDDFNGARVFFSPCGMGLGHVGRALPIADELRGRGAEVMFSTYLEGVDYVRRRGFQVVSSPPLSLESDSTGRVDMRVSAISQGVSAVPCFMQQVTAEIEYMKAFKPDVVLSDTRLSSVIAGKLLGLPVALMLNQFMPIIPRSGFNGSLFKLVDGSVLTLLGRGWAASDVILIPDFPEPYTISLGSLRIPKPYKRLVRMVGFIRPRRPEDAEDTGRVREEAGASEGQRLIYAAISGPTQEREPLVRLLRPMFEGFSDDFRVVMSLGRPDGGSTPSHSGALTTIPWVVDRFEYLKACDLVVCRGGHNTIMQSICYSKPAMIVPTPSHTEQYMNANRAKELGFAELVHQRDLSRDTILRVADELLSDPKYAVNLAEVNSKGFSNGIENTVSALSELLG